MKAAAIAVNCSPWSLELDLWNPPPYADDLQVLEALQHYFEQYHFKDGGYMAKWFHIRLGP